MLPSRTSKLRSSLASCTRMSSSSCLYSRAAVQKSEFWPKQAKQNIIIIIIVVYKRFLSLHFNSTRRISQPLGGDPPLLMTHICLFNHNTSHVPWTTTTVKLFLLIIRKASRNCEFHRSPPSHPTPKHTHTYKKDFLLTTSPPPHQPPHSSPLASYL